MQVTALSIHVIVIADSLNEALSCKQLFKEGVGRGGARYFSRCLVSECTSTDGGNLDGYGLHA